MLESFLQLGQYRYYPKLKKIVDGDNQEIPLRVQSLEVLHLLACKHNQVVSKDEFFTSVWNGLSVTDDSLVQCIGDIRQLLKDRKHKVVQTFPRRGYRLVAESLPLPLTTAATPTYTTSKRPSLTVMSFENIGAGHTGDIIAVGLATDIHSNLAKMSRLFVVAKASACQVQHLLPSEIGEKLGISYLIQGTIQRSKQQVRATISLVETESNRVIWSDQYERTLGDFFQLQDDITLNVVTKLDHCIEQEEIKKAFSAPPDNLGSWELYYQGLWYCTQAKKTLANVERATQLLKQSLALDPSFSPAYATLSSTCINRIFLSTEADTDRHTENALDYAYQCLEYDGQSGWGYWALGRALYIKKQHSQALDALDKSIKYNPNFSWNHCSKALVASHSTGGNNILPTANKALLLSPLDPMKFAFLCAKTHALIKEKNYEAAAISGIQATQEPKTYHLTQVVAALALKLDGQPALAKKHITKAFELMPGFSLQNYRNSLPYDDETSPDRLLEIKALKELGVPEVSRA